MRAFYAWYHFCLLSSYDGRWLRVSSVYTPFLYLWYFAVTGLFGGALKPHSGRRSTQLSTNNTHPSSGLYCCLRDSVYPEALLMEEAQGFVAWVRNLKAYGDMSRMNVVAMLFTVRSQHHIWGCVWNKPFVARVTILTFLILRHNSAEDSWYFSLLFKGSTRAVDLHLHTFKSQTLGFFKWSEETFGWLCDIHCWQHFGWLFINKNWQN